MDSTHQIQIHTYVYTNLYIYLSKQSAIKKKRISNCLKPLKLTAGQHKWGQQIGNRLAKKTKKRKAAPTAAPFVCPFVAIKLQQPETVPETLYHSAQCVSAWPTEQTKAELSREKRKKRAKFVRGNCDSSFCWHPQHPHLDHRLILSMDIFKALLRKFTCCNPWGDP